MVHIGVLKKEVIELLKLRNDGVYLDLTLGAGGHSKAIIESLKSGTLIAIDSDKNAVENFKKELTELGFEQQKGDWYLKSKVKVKIANINFSEILQYLSEIEISNVDGVLADLGWSSDQLESLEGLSHERLNDELDMRMHSSLMVKAKDLLNGFGKKELMEMFKRYADIVGKDAQNLADGILNARSNQPYEKVSDILKTINSTIKFKDRNSKSERIGFYSRVFQALRIAVNDEFNNLTKMLNSSFDLITENGVLLVITFHSGEEKIVKEFISKQVEAESAEIITRQYDEIFTRASIDELRENLRSRSAKLFGIKKI